MRVGRCSTSLLAPQPTAPAYVRAQLLAVNNRQRTPSGLNAAVRKAQKDAMPICLLSEAGDAFEASAVA